MGKSSAGCREVLLPAVTQAPPVVLPTSLEIVFAAVVRSGPLPGTKKEI